MKITLNRIENEVLFRKYRTEGLSIEQASGRLKNIRETLRDLVEKLKEQGKSKETINERFKKEFEKLCQQVNYKGTKRRKERSPTHRKT